MFNIKKRCYPPNSLFGVSNYSLTTNHCPLTTNFVPLRLLEVDAFIDEQALGEFEDVAKLLALADGTYHECGEVFFRAMHAHGNLSGRAVDLGVEMTGL